MNNKKQNNYFEVFPILWGKQINPGDIIQLDPPEDVYTVISNVAFGDLPENPQKNSSILIAEIKTTHIEQIQKEIDSPPIEISNVQIATLIPGKIDQIKVNHSYSPLSDVTLKVSGLYPLYVSGNYIPINEMLNEEEEEIPEEEEMDEKEAQEKALRLVQKHQK